MLGPLRDFLGVLGAALGLALAFLALPSSVQQQYPYLLPIAVAVFGFLLLLSAFDLACEFWEWLRYRGDGKLYDSCIQMHGRLLDFADDRQLTQPQMPWPAPDRETRLKIAMDMKHHSEQSQQMFDARFAAQVVQLVDSLIARGLTDEEGDHMGKSPLGAPWAREIAISLRIRADKLWESKPWPLRWRRVRRTA